MSERWATIAALGTWNAYRTRGVYDPDRETHVQRVYDLAPEPKLQLSGLGKRHGLLGQAIGGAFGVGARERVRQAVEWLSSHQFDRLLLVGHSRGCGVEGAIIRRMEKERARAWRRGEPAPYWCRVDCLVMLDPVLSFGLAAPAKWLSRFLPRKLRWHWNLDRYRTLPAFVGCQIATYALDEKRTAFEPTHFRLTAPQAASWRRWLPGVHCAHGGYPREQPEYRALDEEHSQDVGSWLRAALSLRVPALAGVAWPWPELEPLAWREEAAQPAARRHLPGDLAAVRV